MAALVTVTDHPLIRHKVSLLRDVETPVSVFRALAQEITMLMAYEALRDLETETTEVQTPLAIAEGHRLAGKKLAVVAILRAGLAMVDGILPLVPSARVGHIGLYRDPETKQPVEYYLKMPQDLADRDVVVVDPMLATAGSAAAAIDRLKELGTGSLRLLCLIGAPEGVEVMQQRHPDVPIWLAALDSHLDDHAYIVPGLGDAGDRIFGTK
ncbi:MAG: uracil phosphoribosyltransferase [Actinomycetota bacterium]